VIVLFVESPRFFDTTLRDGEQTPGVSLTPAAKLEIATALADIGVHVIEAGSAAASDGERESIRTIADAGLAAECCAYVRALPGDIDLAADAGADSVHLVVPVSDLHITKKLRKTREQVCDMAWSAVEYAKSHGLIVELSGEDASRADQAFLAASSVRESTGAQTDSVSVTRSGSSRPSGRPRSSPRSSLPRSPSTATTTWALRSQTRSLPSAPGHPPSTSPSTASGSGQETQPSRSW